MTRYKVMEIMYTGAPQSIMKSRGAVNIVSTMRLEVILSYPVYRQSCLIALRCSYRAFHG